MSQTPVKPLLSSSFSRLPLLGAPALLAALAAASLATLAGCADAGTGEQDVAPDLFDSADDEPLQTGTIAVEFVAHLSPSKGSITIERAPSLASSEPLLGALSMDTINISNDDVPGEGTPNTVELVTNSTGANAECPAPYTNKTFCGNVTLRHFFDRSLPNTFVHVTKIDPPTGHNAVNQDASQLGLSNTYGLWSYTAAGAAATGLLGQSPLNHGTRDWVFADPDGADTSITLNVVASLHYSNYSSPFTGSAFVDACSGGTDLLGEPYAEVTMPFPFTLYESTSSLVKFAETGMITFGNVDPVNDGENVALPSVNAPRPAIFTFWDDVSLGPNGHMCYKTTGSAPNRKFIITWNQIDFNSAPDSGSSLTFGAILSEGTNKIELAYQSMLGPTARRNGASATVGVQNATGTAATGRFNSAIFTTNKKYPLNPIP